MIRRQSRQKQSNLEERMQIKQAWKELAKCKQDTEPKLKLITFDVIRSSGCISGCVHSGLASMNGEGKESTSPL